MENAKPGNPRALLKELAEKFQVFRESQPLAIGINKQLAALYPDVDVKVLRAALYHHTSSSRYLKTMEKATQRFDLEGKPQGDVTEDQRKHAAEQLAERYKKQAEQRKAEADARRAAEDARRAEERRAAKLNQLAEKFARR